MTSRLAALGIGLLFSLIEGIVLVCLWGWYLVPLGVKDINLAQAVGLGLIVSSITSHYAFREEENGEVLDVLELLLIRPIVTLGLGWALHFFV